MTDAPDEAPDGLDGAGADQARLRPLVGTDVPRVAELERQLFGPSAWSEPMIAGELHAPARWYLAAVEGQDTLVGYAGLWFDGDAGQVMTCLLYTSDAADDLLCVDLGGR